MLSSLLKVTVDVSHGWTMVASQKPDASGNFDTEPTAAQMAKKMNATTAANQPRKMKSLLVVGAHSPVHPSAMIAKSTASRRTPT